MSEQTDQRTKQEHVLDIPSAAFQAGYSSRHFRRVIEEDHIPVKRIGQKYFITLADLESWKSTRGEVRLDQCLKQLDVWLKYKEDVRRGAQPVHSLDDDE